MLKYITNYNELKIIDDIKDDNQEDATRIQKYGEVI